MAQRLGISKAVLSKTDNARNACSLTHLSRPARGLDVPVTALFRGMDDERETVFVPAGHAARSSGGAPRPAMNTPSSARCGASTNWSNCPAGS